jgi:hypothetical protein
MASVRDAVTRALQRAKVVALGKDPKSAEATLALETFQSMLDGWVEDGMFGSLCSVYETANYTAKENERVIAPSAITVTKPTTISNEGNRAPWELACIVTILNGTQTNYVYTKGAWLSLTGLTLDSALPFENYGRSGLEALLATKLVETFGGQPSPFLVNEGRKFQGRIMFKGGERREPVVVDDY